MIQPQFLCDIYLLFLKSHEAASGVDIMPSIKIDKPLVVYI